jgi:hypothetical protein
MAYQSKQDDTPILITIIVFLTVVMIANSGIVFYTIYNMVVPYLFNLDPIFLHQAYMMHFGILFVFSMQGTFAQNDDKKSTHTKNTRKECLSAINRIIARIIAPWLSVLFIWIAFSFS